TLKPIKTSPVITVTCLVGAAGPITGAISVSANATGVPYSVGAVTNATAYNWTVPSDATVASGQGTQSITVNFGCSSGIVTVTPGSTCGGTGTGSNKEVTVTDTTVPTINCAAVAAQSANADANCEAIVPDVRNLVRSQSSDNCTAQNQLDVTQNPQQGSV